MGLKLAVGNSVVVPVQIALKDNLKEKKFSFELVCDRLEEEDFQTRIKDEKTELPSNTRIREVMREITTGWRGQTLVLDDDGQPAPFSDEAFSMMIGMSGMLDAITRSYVKEANAKLKN